MYTQSIWTKPTSMFCTFLVYIQSETSSGKTLSAISIDFSSVMNCICCSWVYLNSYCTGCSNTWKLEMSRINLTIHSHRYLDIQACSAPLNHMTHWNAAPSRENRSAARIEHWQWIELHLWTTPRKMANYSWKSLSCNGMWSSVGIMWILSTC